LQLTCGICFEWYSSDMMSSAACAHFYCHECWQGLPLPISRFPLYFFLYACMVWGSGMGHYQSIYFKNSNFVLYNCILQHNCVTLTTSWLVFVANWLWRQRHATNLWYCTSTILQLLKWLYIVKFVFCFSFIFAVELH
jgi:hypothetical protein